MLPAVIKQLKTGSVKNVYSTYDGVVNPKTPYIMVWEAEDVPTGVAQSIGGVFVAYHGKLGLQRDLNNYMKNEVITLLHNKVLTKDNGDKFMLQSVNILTPVIDSNDDESISRDRLFTLPVIGVV